MQKCMNDGADLRLGLIGKRDLLVGKRGLQIGKRDLLNDGADLRLGRKS